MSIGGGAKRLISLRDPVELEAIVMSFFVSILCDYTVLSSIGVITVNCRRPATKQPRVKSIFLTPDPIERASPFGNSPEIFQLLAVTFQFLS